MNWESFSDLLPILLWILILIIVRKKKGRRVETPGHPDEPGMRGPRPGRRSRKRDDFPRDYEPIEPS